MKAIELVKFLNAKELPPEDTFKHDLYTIPTSAVVQVSWEASEQFYTITHVAVQMERGSSDNGMSNRRKRREVVIGLESVSTPVRFIEDAELDVKLFEQVIL